MTYFTIKQIPDGRFAVHTIHLETGCVGGHFFYKSAARAFEVVTEAYKTPLVEVDWPTYRDAVKRSEARLVGRQAVAV